MSVRHRISEDGKEALISIHGRFDFTLHEDFRDAYRNADRGVRVFRVNLSQADYMDSSALGMLLLLRDHAGDNARLVIESPADEIRNTLKIANFDKLFSVE